MTIGGPAGAGAGLGRGALILPAPAGLAGPVGGADGADRQVTLHPKGGEPVTVTALRAREESPPAGVEPLDWRLLSNRPADTLDQATGMDPVVRNALEYRSFFRIFKTGCRVEALQLSTLERLEPALAVYSDHRLADSVPDCWGGPPELPAMPSWTRRPASGLCRRRRRPLPVIPPPLPAMLGWIARLGGHLGRKSDGPPGPRPRGSACNVPATLAWGKVG